MIQIITNKIKKDEIFDKNIQFSKLESPLSFDMFDINIIDLQDASIWCNDGNKTSSINKINDLESISSIIGASRKSNIIVVLPLNHNFRYYYDSAQHKYRSTILLKDMITNLQHILSSLHRSFENTSILRFEPTITKIGKFDVTSNFVFTNIYVNNQLTLSEGSERCTSFAADDKLIITTLNITEDNNVLKEYLHHIGIEKIEREKEPEWVSALLFNDDQELRRSIDEKQFEINKAQQVIDNCNKALEKNKEYKSILYSNGEELVRIVFEILERLFDYDLSCFCDKKKEDFLIQLPQVSFIGEIKGVTSNIKSENVSQIDNHYHGYMDRLREGGKEEKVKELLIMNPLRNKPLAEREPVHEIQIELAERNSCLIIETNVLLKLFETFLRGEIDTLHIIDILSQKSGILKCEDFA